MKRGPCLVSGLGGRVCRGSRLVEGLLGVEVVGSSCTCLNEEEECSLWVAACEWV